jgi:glycerophosphoryl diester phosphodiesterase
VHKTLNLAHRGANRVAPENTIAAFRKAVELGADGFELDLQLSKDNVPVIIHDEKLERTTGAPGLVKDLTLAELKSLDAGSWFGPEFSGEKIPTLNELFDEFAGEDLFFNLELKTGIVLYPGLEDAVIKIVAERGLKERAILSSFNHYSLVTCLETDSEIKTGMLYLAGLFEPWKYAKTLGCYSVHPFFYNLQSPEIVSGFKESGLPIFAWTVNESLYMQMMVAGEIDGIITDLPGELKSILGEA